MSRIVSTLIYIIIGLAVIGVAAQLLTNTANFFISVLIMVGIGVAIFAVLYFFVLRQRPSSEMKKYKQAVKQSKLKYKDSNEGTNRSPKKLNALNKRKKTRRRASHLRVIEGNKSKSKKKRASN